MENQEKDELHSEHPKREPQAYFPYTECALQIDPKNNGRGLGMGIKKQAIEHSRERH